MKVKVLKSFLDKENNVIQKAGKIIEVTEDRFEQINSVKVGLLIEVSEEDLEEESDFPKHTGGGWYKLSNGEKVKGKDEALKAENDLNNND